MSASSLSSGPSGIPFPRFESVLGTSSGNGYARIPMRSSPLVNGGLVRRKGGHPKGWWRVTEPPRWPGGRAGRARRKETADQSGGRQACATMLQSIRWIGVVVNAARMY